MIAHFIFELSTHALNISLICWNSFAVSRAGEYGVPLRAGAGGFGLFDILDNPHNDTPVVLYFLLKFVASDVTAR